MCVCSEGQSNIIEYEHNNIINNMKSSSFFLLLIVLLHIGAYNAASQCSITWNQTLPNTVNGSIVLQASVTDNGQTSNLVSFSSSNTNVAKISGTGYSGSTLTIVGTGTTNITAIDAGFFCAPSKQQVITVSKQNQTITWNQTLSSYNVGDPSITLIATASSNLPVTYTSSNTSAATISGNTLRFVGAYNGYVTITASQAGDNTFNPAPNLTKNIVVNKGNQTITWNQTFSSSYNVGSFPITLTAMASSGLPVSYTSSDPSVANVNGNTLSFVGAGTAIISAQQTGNTDYNFAYGPSYTITVTAGNITIPSVTLKVIDQSKGTITNAPDHNKTNIFCWIDDNLAVQNTLTPSNWWYPLYDTSISDGTDVNITPNGQLIQEANDWTWQITLKAAPGTYQWNPYAKSLGWNPINPNMYAYTGDNSDNNLVFTVSSTGEISGHTQLVIPNNTEITKIGLNNVVVVGGKSSLFATFDGKADVAIYSIQGMLIQKTTVQSAFEADNLPAGVYLVKINTTTVKLIII